MIHCDHRGSHSSPVHRIVSTQRGVIDSWPREMSTNDSISSGGQQDFNFSKIRWTGRRAKRFQVESIWGRRGERRVAFVAGEPSDGERGN